MYYIIETTYIGPNQHEDEYVDADTIRITTSPARTNMSNESRIEGWCGTTNDWSTYAHGEYATLDEARAAIAEKFGLMRKSDSEHCFEDIVETYKPGKYTPMSAAETADWSYAGFREDIDANTSDDRISELIRAYEALANDDGYTLHYTLQELMYERRQELRDSED